MKTILFFKASEYTPSHQKLAGARRAAQGLGLRLIHVNGSENNHRSIPKLIAFWQPAGVIIDCSLNTDHMKPLLRLDVPTVHLGLRCQPGQAIYSVHGRRPDIVRAAAQELLLLDCSAYAYVGYPGSPEWSADRGHLFQETIVLHGRQCLTFEPRRREDSLSHSLRLRAWLTGLPRPCGIFAANDNVARHILNQCMILHLRVPADIAVVGVDNDETICRDANPPLTSVMPDWERLGHESVVLLSRIIRNPRLKPISIEAGGTLIVIRRASTRNRPTYPGEVSKAIALIREKACDGLKARDVIAMLHGSRRSVEQAFRKATGHSILDEIQSVRMEQARNLLATRTRTVAAVAHLCGYASLSSFCKQYRKTYGQPPSQPSQISLP